MQNILVNLHKKVLQSMGNTTRIVDKKDLKRCN